MQSFWAATDKPLIDVMAKASQMSTDYNRSSTSEESSDSDSKESCISFKAVPEQFRPNTELHRAHLRKKKNTYNSNASDTLNTSTAISERTERLDSNEPLLVRSKDEKYKQTILTSDSPKSRPITKNKEVCDKTGKSENYSMQLDDYMKVNVVENDKSSTSDKEVKEVHQEHFSVKDGVHKTNHKLTSSKGKNSCSPKLYMTSKKVKNRIKYERTLLFEHCVAQEVGTIEIDVAKLKITNEHDANVKHHSNTLKGQVKKKKKPRARLKCNNLSNTQNTLGNNGNSHIKQQSMTTGKVKNTAKANNSSNIKVNKPDQFVQNSLPINDETSPPNVRKIEWTLGSQQKTEKKNVCWQIQNELLTKDFNSGLPSQIEVNEYPSDDELYLNFIRKSDLNKNSFSNPQQKLWTEAQYNNKQTLHLGVSSCANYKQNSKCICEHTEAKQTCQKINIKSMPARFHHDERSNSTNIYSSCTKCVDNKYDVKDIAYCQNCMTFNKTTTYPEKERKENMQQPVQQNESLSKMESKENQNLILQQVKEIADHIVGSHVALSSLFTFYHEWVIYRKKVIDEFHELVKNIEKSPLKLESYSDLFETMKLGASVASNIPNPYISMAAKLVTIFSSFAQKLLRRSKQTNIDDLEITIALLREKDASTSLYMYGLQCNQQLTETVKLIEQFHSSDIIRNFNDSKNEDIMTFLTGFLEYNPLHHSFYKKLKICFQELLNNGKSSLSKKLCEPFSLYSLKAVDIIGFLDWRFNIEDFNAESVQIQLEEISNLLQNKSLNDTLNIKDLAKKMRICVSILEDELRLIERCVSKISALDCTFDTSFIDMNNLKK